MCDMIRSGELMKYPLAIVSKLFERYGADAGIGYDIISLGKKTVGLRMRGIVPASTDMHITDCVSSAGIQSVLVSRPLSTSNNKSTGISIFHDLDKHAALGNFIFQNYRQAVEKITANRLNLKVLEDQLHTSATDYEQDLKDERVHLESLLNEPAGVQKTVGYIELLGKLDIATYLSFSDAARTAERDFKNLDHLIINQGFTRKEIALVRTRYRKMWECLTMVDERQLNLKKSTPSRHVPRQSTRALVEYNGAARMLNPPQDPLIWARVIETVLLAEFDLLQDTCIDIRRLPWTQPAQREAGLLHFGIKRAKEEIRRLNVEITRIITFDEHADFYKAIAVNLYTSPHLARELSERWKFKARINEAIVERFVKASQLPGFTGSLFCDPNLTLSWPLPVWATNTLGLSQIAVEIKEDNDHAEASRELEGLDTDNVIHLMDSLEIEAL
ncbi:hypothetical protein B0H14DRAFT_2605778 [Mycena olivaceomarginata]|nr:hypothetical protein B0H14DRAFT_2605778 [Mycena olivaceomarginata]